MYMRGGWMSASVLAIDRFCRVHANCSEFFRHWKMEFGLLSDVAGIVVNCTSTNALQVGFCNDFSCYRNSFPMYRWPWRGHADHAIWQHVGRRSRGSVQIVR